MSIKRALTDNELLGIVRTHRGRPVEDIDVLRAIERAILQLLNTRESVGYAGVTVWFGKNKCTRILTRTQAELASIDLLAEDFKIARSEVMKEDI